MHPTTPPHQSRAPRTRLRPLCALLAATGLWQPVAAATSTWVGGASSNWSAPGNWLEGSVPASAADTGIVLDAAGRATSFNDIAGGLVLNRLTLGAQAAAPVLSGQALRFQGPDATLRMLSDNGFGKLQTALVLGSTLEVAGGPSLRSQLQLQGAISGSGGLHLASGITTIDNSANSWTGLTRVDAGATLGTAFSALNNTTRVAVASGGELQLIGPGGLSPAAVVNAPVQLGGLLSASAQQVLVFGQFAPGAFVNATVSLTDAARILAFNGSHLVLTNTVDRAGQALTLETAGAGNLVALNTALAGHGDLLLQPGGGTLLLGAVLGNGSIRASGQGGTVELGTVGSDGGSGVLQVAFNPQSFGTVAMKGVISGNRPLQVSGGTLDLGSLAHSFSGTVALSGGGLLRAANSASLGAAGNLLHFAQGGTLELTGRNGSLTHDIVTTGGTGAVLVGASVRRDVTSTIRGDGGIAFADFSGGQSVVTLSGRNSFSGGLGVGSGVVLGFASDDNLGAVGGGITLGGALSVPDAYTLNRPLTVDGQKAAFNAGTAGVYTLASDITGSGLLSLGGTAPGTVFMLAGHNAGYSGGVLVHGNPGTDTAVLLLDDDARLGAPTGVLHLGRSNGGLPPRPGTLRAAADLAIAASRSTSFRSMTVDTNGFDVVFNQPIDGLGMTKAGAGTWRLNTANTNTSGDNRVQVLQGTLALGAPEALGARSQVALAADTRLLLGGHALSLTSLDTQAGSSVDLGQVGQVGQGGQLSPLFGTLDGTLTGQGRLVAGRAGFVPASITLNGANTFTGSIDVTLGSRLVVGHVQALGAAGNVLRLDNGTLGTSAALAAPLVLSEATNLQIGPGGAGFLAQGQSLVIARALTGHTPLRIQGGSQPGDGGAKFDVRLAHAGNSFTGDLVLGDPQGFGSAALGITADGALGAAGNRLVLGATVFDGESNRSAQGGLRAWAPVALAASRVVLLDGHAGSTAGWIDSNGFTVVLQGGIGELHSRLGLLKVGEGTLVMNGDSSFSGLLRVAEGALGGHGVLGRVAIDGAVLAPGESAGLLTIRQDLAFQDGTLAMELGGLARGSGYDALDVGGSVDLGSGTVLQLGFIQGFRASAGQQFQLVDADTDVFGRFANVDDGARLLTSDGAGSFVVHYGAGQGLRLSDFQASAPVPEPGSWALLALGLLGLGAAARRRGAGPA